MHIGIGMPNQVRDVNAAAIPAWARKAEEAGFSRLATTGRQAYPGVADTVALAAAAAVTSEIGLLSTILLAPTWPGVLLAKELASIDGVSGGRLTVGLGVGSRPDDFVADGHGPHGRGARLDRDLETYHEVWDGKPVGGGPNPAVPAGPAGTRHIPLLFGGFVPAALARMARWGEGYVGPTMPTAMAAGMYEAARAAWREAGREGSPRVVAPVYFALSDPDGGRDRVHDYYTSLGDATADLVTGTVCVSPEMVTTALAAYRDLGVDEVIFLPGTDDPDDVARLADAAL